VGDRTRAIIREITPPVLLRATRALRAPFAPERPPEYYDDLFQKSPGYSLPYTQSHYYFLWAVIADRLATANARRILDIGCGPGQFATLLYDKGFRHYCGIDFSATAIQLARTRCPDFEFVCADLRDPGLLEGRMYDWALVLETLEHVDDDLGLLSRLHPGCGVFLTVPKLR
jgi:2-polyprenyl-3-methyl-5-hydroxy-6-metoxy-1,4-benzoquinol methylase